MIIDGSMLTHRGASGLSHSRQRQPERGSNLLEGGAPFYACYVTADGRWMNGPLRGYVYLLSNTGTNEALGCAGARSNASS